MSHFLLLSFLCLIFVVLSTSQCINCHMNTKTHYPERPTCAPHEVIDPVECPAGELVHFNLVIRHGSRQPTLGDVNTFTALQKNLQTYGKYITNTNFLWMKDWVNPFRANEAGLLNVVGEIEHYNMSKRILDRYYPHFSSEYTPLVYPITNTAINRASRSAISFGFGLLEGTGVIGKNNFQPFSAISASQEDDIVLRFFENCPLYTQQILNNSTWKFNSKQYLAQYSENILRKVITLLGVNTTFWPLTFSDVTSFYKACSFEVATDLHYNHFCGLFDIDDIYCFETSNDLSDYWIKGYGNKLNYQISCPLLKDFWTSILHAIEGDSYEKAKLRFAHAETILPFAALLGLFRDDFILTYDSPELDTRKWRTSNISPFAANIAMGLYNCSGIYKIKLLHNEVEMPIPGCGGVTYCPLEQFTSLFQNALNCNFQALCDIPTYMT